MNADEFTREAERASELIQELFIQERIHPAVCVSTMLTLAISAHQDYRRDGLEDFMKLVVKLWQLMEEKNERKTL